MVSSWEPLPLEHHALNTPDTCLDHHDENDEVEEVLLVGEEDEEVHHGAIHKKPNHQYPEISAAVWFANGWAFNLVGASWAPTHVVVVADQVDLHKVEEGVGFQKV